MFSSPTIAIGPVPLDAVVGGGPRKAVLVVSPHVADLDATRRIVGDVRRLDPSCRTLRAPPGIPTAAAAGAIVAEWPEGTDLVVAVGGGSTIDLAKAARYLWSAGDGPGSRDPAPPLLVGVPTTGGSGAEAIDRVALGDPGGTGTQTPWIGPGVRPDRVLLDPEFVRSVPALTARRCAFEALAHAIEALVSDWANPFSDALARDALAGGIPAFQRLARQPRDAPARAEMHRTAAKAGLAAASASLGLAHALAIALASVAPAVPYAAWLPITLPVVVEYNFASSRDRHLGIGAMLPATTGPVGTMADRLRELARSAGLPTDLAGLGVDGPEILRRKEEIVARTLRSPSTIGNPRVPSAGELAHLVDRLVPAPSGPVR
ncbi:MAG: iron-containing alcohol dehydrogenase [Thermoplasmata archaeon]